MSKFYVGQRVRIVACAPGNCMERNVGRVGIITARWLPPFRYAIKHPESMFHEYWILDCCPTNPSGKSFGWLADHLSPATYDGNEKVSWSECLWQPTPERAA